MLQSWKAWYLVCLSARVYTAGMNCIWNMMNSKEKGQLSDFFNLWDLLKFAYNLSYFSNQTIYLCTCTKSKTQIKDDFDWKT